MKLLITLIISATLLVGCTSYSRNDTRFRIERTYEYDTHQVHCLIQLNGNRWATIVDINKEFHVGDLLALDSLIIE